MASNICLVASYMTGAVWAGFWMLFSLLGLRKSGPGKAVVVSLLITTVMSGVMLLLFIYVYNNVLGG